MNTIKIEYKDNYAIVELDNGKVNAISSELSGDLAKAFTELEKNEKVKGVILTGRPHGFSAGLDVVDLVSGGAEGSRKFWVNYHDALQAMVNFSKPFVCAITGYAPAGATIFTLCADYRIMGKGPKHVMGMHEFKMSLQIPEMLCDIYAYYMGEKEAWAAVQKAQLFNSDEALVAGLVNESVEVEEVLPRAIKHLKKQMNVYLPVFQETKQYMRRGLLAIVNKDTAPYVQAMVDNAEKPATKMMVEMFLASLKK